MFDLTSLLGQMLSSGISGGRRRPRDSGAFGIPGVSKASLGVGAIGIAIAAWEHYKGQSAAPATAPPTSTSSPAYAPPPPPPPPMSPPATLPVAAPAAAANVVDPGEDRNADAAHLIRSMIAAANADGLIDAQERAAILERAMEAGLDPATQQFLMGELRAPATLEQIVAATRPDLRLETYAAGLLAVNVDSDAERTYLDRLASALGLSAEDRQRVQEQLGAG